MRGTMDSLISTILWFSPMGHKDLVIYPDARWLDEPERKHRMIRWLDGELEGIYWEMKEMSVVGLREMLEDCMDQIVWDYGIEHRVPNLPTAMTQSKQWASLWNGFLGVTNPSEQWDAKAQIIDAYATENRWKEETKPIVGLLIGEKR